MPSAVVPQPAYENLVTEAPLGEISVLFDAWKNRSVDKRRAALAAINWASFGANLAFAEPNVFGAAPAGDFTDAEIEAAFAEAQAFTGPLDGRPFLKIIFNVAVKLLPLLLL